MRSAANPQPKRSADIPVRSPAVAGPERSAALTLSHGLLSLHVAADRNVRAPAFPEDSSQPASNLGLCSAAASLIARGQGTWPTNLVGRLPPGGADFRRRVSAWVIHPSPIGVLAPYTRKASWVTKIMPTDSQPPPREGRFFLSRADIQVRSEERCRESPGQTRAVAGQICCRLGHQRRHTPELGARPAVSYGTSEGAAENRAQTP